MSDPCICPIAGWCERHGMAKDAHLHNLCQTRGDYRRLWDDRIAMADKFCGDWSQVGEAVWRCGRCNRMAGATTFDQLPGRRPCRIRGERSTPDPNFGPGTELAALIAELRLPERPGCNCKAKAAQMDRWGIAGCREHFDEIVGWIEESYQKSGKLDRLKAACHAVCSGLAFQLDPFHPLQSLLTEAISRAEAKLEAIQ